MELDDEGPMKLEERVHHMDEEPEADGGEEEGGISGLVSRNVIVAGRRTSMRLEPGMWDALTDAARRERMNIHELVTMISGRRGRGSSLTCSVRAFLVMYFRSAATEDGHVAAGHGRLRDRSM